MVAWLRISTATNKHVSSVRTTERAFLLLIFLSFLPSPFSKKASKRQNAGRAVICFDHENDGTDCVVLILVTRDTHGSRYYAVPTSGRYQRTTEETAAIVRRYNSAVSIHFETPLTELIANNFAEQERGHIWSFGFGFGSIHPIPQRYQIQTCSKFSRD